MAAARAKGLSFVKSAAQVDWALAQLYRWVCMRAREGMNESHAADVCVVDFRAHLTCLV